MRWEAALYKGDTLEVMAGFADRSVDMILCDLPYGTTARKWDVVIPFDKLWEQYKRVIKPRGAIVLTASQPFTSALVMSNQAWFKYCWVWDKVNLNTGALTANKMPMKRHEDVVVFCQKSPTYNKQYQEGVPVKGGHRGGHGAHIGGAMHLTNERSDKKNPCSVLQFKGMEPGKKSVHPTQKPVALMEYLIKTYTNEGELVLDNTMGSGTTGVACMNTRRYFTGIERDDKYFAIADERITQAVGGSSL